MKLIWQNKSQTSLKQLKPLAKQYVDYVATRFDLTHDEVAITLVTAKQMTSYNEAFRGRKEPTDVLTFPGDEAFLGDIIICYPVVQTKANEEAMSEKDYFIFTVVHGLLHALGYDHQTDQDYESMMSLQDDIIQKGAIT